MDWDDNSVETLQRVRDRRQKRLCREIKCIVPH